MKRLMLLILLLTGLCSAALAGDTDVAGFTALHLPGYTLTNGCVFDQTAMLLIEDDREQAYFAGCVRDGEDWTITLSTPLPAWRALGLDTYHAGEGSILLSLAPFPDDPLYADAWQDVWIELQEDGSWQVEGVINDYEAFSFTRHGFYESCGFSYYGSRPYLLDITRLSWGSLPRTFREAMETCATDFWWVCAVQYTPIHAAPDEASPILMLLDSRTPVHFYAQQQDWMQVNLPGREETGWIRTGNLLPGSIQTLWYEQWMEDSSAYGAKEIILEDDDPAMTWYAAAHEEGTAAPLVIDGVASMACLGWCARGCCRLLYSEETGLSGFVPSWQLACLPE